MRIGIFTDAYDPIVSGVSTSIGILADELEKLNHEVIIVTFESEGQEKADFVIRYKGRTLPMKGLEQYKIAKASRAKIKMLEHLNLDLVHVHTEFTMGRLGLKYAKKHKVPVVYTYHTMYEDYVHFISPLFKPILKVIARKYCMSFIKKSTEAVFPTRKVDIKFKSWGYTGTPNIIPTGIYLERFRKINYHTKDINQLKEKLGINKKDTVLLFIGRLSREKSVSDLIENFNNLLHKHPTTKLVLVGDGPDRSIFEEQVEAYGISNSVIFTGMVPQSIVGLYYQLGDIFVNFSVTETQGLTYIEALASGLPLLVKYDHNLEDVIVNGKNGFSFNDNSEFLSYFEKITNNKLVLDELKHNTKESIDKFSAKNFGKRMEEVYKKALKNSD